MLWVEPSDQGHRLQLARFLGQSWGSPQTLVDGPELVIDARRPPRVALTDGALTVAYEVTEGGRVRGMASRSADRGRTWQSEPWAGDPAEGGWTLDPQGEVFRALGAHGLQRAIPGESPRQAPILWEEGMEAAGGLRLCVCTAPVTAGGGDPTLVAFRTRDDQAHHGVAVARPTDAGWRAVQVHPDGWQVAGCSPAPPALARTTRGVVVGWYSGEPAPTLKLAFSEDGGRTFDHPLEIDAQRADHAPWPPLSLAPLPDGSVAAVWTARQTEEVLLLSRRFTLDGEVSPPSILDRLPLHRAPGAPQAVAVHGGLLAAWTDAGGEGAPGGLRTPYQPAAALHQPTLPARRANPPAAASPLPDTLRPLLTHHLDGTPQTLPSGHPILLSVLAGWCAPCVDPLLQVDPPPRVHRVALLLDPPPQVEALREAGWELLRADPEAVREALGSAHVPSSYLFDARGALLWSTRDPLHPDDRALHTAIQRALQTPAPRPTVGITTPQPSP